MDYANWQGILILTGPELRLASAHDVLVVHEALRPVRETVNEVLVCSITPQGQLTWWRSPGTPPTTRSAHVAAILLAPSPTQRGCHENCVTRPPYLAYKSLNNKTVLHDIIFRIV